MLMFHVLFDAVLLALHGRVIGYYLINKSRRWVGVGKWEDIPCHGVIHFSAVLGINAVTITV